MATFNDVAFKNTFEGMEEITYANLVTKRNNNQLIPGKLYRITDYVTTTTQAYTRVPGSSDVSTANYQPVFDVIVKANSVNTLSENAGAIQRTGNLRFANSKLSAWKLRYCLDNDTSRFAWANTTNGKGVIYYMEDEFENKCGYDFKSIQFQRYKITAKTDSKKPDALVNTYHGMRQLNQSTLYPQGYTINTSDFRWYYTFGVDEGSDPSASISDKSMNKNGTTSTCCSNEIEPLFGNVGQSSETTHTQYLNSIVFLNDASSSTTINATTMNNKFGGRCHTISFGINCYSNSFGDNCYYNNFGNTYNSNSFGDGCYSIIFGNYCGFNSFGNNCYSNTFGNSCYSNTFGNGCYNNNFGNTCSFNSFGNKYYDNSFGNDCTGNSFGNDCTGNSFGNDCDYNIFGNGCASNSFGNSCVTNNIGNKCAHNSFDINCISNSFGNNCLTNNIGSYCEYNSFGNNCKNNSLISKCYNNSFDGNCCSNSINAVSHYNSFGKNCFKYTNISFSGKQIKLGFNGDISNGFITSCVIRDGKIYVSGTIYNNFDVDKTVNFKFFLEWFDGEDEDSDLINENVVATANSSTLFEFSCSVSAVVESFSVSGTATFQVGDSTITSKCSYEY